MKLTELTDYLDARLNLDCAPGDPSNNGLQTQGSEEVKKAVFGVDACLALFEIAADKNADFIFVHHGLSWKDSLKRLTGMNASRIKPLFKNDISLYAAHLPLDAHPEIGHNAKLAEMIGLENTQMFSEYAGIKIGVKGELKEEKTPEELGKLLDSQLGSKHKIYGPADKKIKRVGIISGGAGADGIVDAFNEGLDLQITGEVEHSSYHPIKETGISVLSLGHYCSEKPGVMAVMEELQEKFNLDCEFINLPTGL
jgi:dinuclear metal center YbgI/SA1388 family protein